MKISTVAVGKPLQLSSKKYCETDKSKGVDVKHTHKVCIFPWLYNHGNIQTLCVCLTSTPLDLSVSQYFLLDSWRGLPTATVDIFISH